MSLCSGHAEFCLSLALDLVIRDWSQWWILLVDLTPNGALTFMIQKATISQTSL